MEFVLLVLGLVLLIKAADYFVDASTSIARIFRVSEIIIGATIVSIGTTLPETMVSAVSAVKGHGDISYGNALGSIICNTSLIAAISFLFSPGTVDKEAIKRPVYYFFGSYIVYVFFAFFFKGFNRLSGIILISIFVLYVFSTVKSATDGNSAGAKDERSSESIIKPLLILIASAIVIAFASNLLVDNGIIIARKFGMPESVIGITIIALGTSLPELTTAITALVKGYSNLSIGNVIGANFLNIVNVTGIAALLNPFKIPTSKTVFGINSSYIVDIPVAFIVMFIMTVPVLKSGKTSRWQGIVLVLIYICFIAFQYITN